MADFLHQEKTWEQLLSREPQRIKKNFSSLDEDSQRTVIAHLKEMTTGSGWHPEQVKSATVAIKAILE